MRRPFVERMPATPADRGARAFTLLIASSDAASQARSDLAAHAA